MEEAIYQSYLVAKVEFGRNQTQVPVHLLSQDASVYVLLMLIAE